MRKQVIPFLFLFSLLGSLLTACRSISTTPEKDLWGKWQYISNEDGNSAYFSDLEFHQDGNLVIQGRNEPVEYVVIAPGRMKISISDQANIINYEVSEESLILFFDTGQNLYKTVLNVDSSSSITTNTIEPFPSQITTTPKKTSTQQIIPEITITSKPEEFNSCADISFEGDPLCDNSWPMHGHDPSRTSWNKAENTLTPPLGISWFQSIQNYIIGDISLTDDMIFLSGSTYRENKNNNSVYALDKTGNVVWSYDLRTGTGAMGNAVAYNENAIFFSGQHDDLLYSLESNSGNPLWTTSGIKGLFGSPINIQNDVIYAFGEQSSIFAINSHTGRIIWSHEADGWGGSTAIWEDSIIALSWNTSLIALNKYNGEVLWERNDIKTNFSRVIAIDGLAYFGSWNLILALDISNGQNVWSTALPVDFQGKSVTNYEFAFTDGIIYVAGGERAEEENPIPQNILLAIDAKSGEILWKTKVEITWGGPIVANNCLYAYFQDDFSTTGEVKALNATTGEEIWHWQPNSGQITGFVVADEFLYLSYYDNSDSVTSPISYIIAFTNE